MLDFSFGRFLYKNDDQLAHEMIAMQMARYVNKIIGKQIIIEYLIQPECLGALYEFVENAMTIH